MDQRIGDFLARNAAAAMITLRPDGQPHAVRVAVAVVEDNVWSSGVASRVRTAHLRRDPRSTLYVPEAGGYGWLTLEGRVRLIDGDEAPALNLKLFRQMQGRPEPAKLAWFGREVDEAEFLDAMRAERRLVYEFAVLRAYGMDAAGGWSARYG